VSFTDIANQSFHLKLEDPQDLLPVEAFCRLTEMHINWEKKLIVVIYSCWRSQQAFLASREPFRQLQVELPPNDGGTTFLDSNQPGNAFKATLNAFILQTKLPNATPIDPLV